MELATVIGADRRKWKQVAETWKRSCALWTSEMRFSASNAHAHFSKFWCKKNENLIYLKPFIIIFFLSEIHEIINFPAETLMTRLINTASELAIKPKIIPSNIKRC